MPQWLPKDKWGKPPRDLRVVSPTGVLGLSPAALVPKLVRPVGLAYVHPQNRTAFEPSPFDLGEIGRAASTESLITRSFAKHSALCMKESWDLVGKDSKALEYVRRRLFEFEMVTTISFDEILRDIINNIVSYSNQFVVYRRDKSRSSGRSYKKFGKLLEPIAGIFTADPVSMNISRNKFGEAKRYWQMISGSLYARRNSKYFDKEDVLHLTYAKRTGFAWGTPFVVPVLDDIRLLRRLEELANLVCHKGAFPMYQYQVGTEETPPIDYEDGSTEVSMAQRAVQEKEAHGFFVTPGTHMVKNVDGSAPIRDITPYLEFFEQRVISGLNLSGVDLGRGNSASRSTATEMSKGLQNQCKDFQRSISCGLQQFFDDLLAEGGFQLTPESRVALAWPEIDIETQQIVENHSMALYQGHALTQGEMRLRMNREPLSDEQQKEMYFVRVELERIDAQAKAKAALASSQAAENTASNKNQPKNQHGTKPARGSTQNDQLRERLALLMESIEQQLLDSDVDSVKLPEAATTIICETLQDLFDEDIRPIVRPRCALLYGIPGDDVHTTMLLTHRSLSHALEERLNGARSQDL